MSINELAHDFTAMLQRGEHMEAATKYYADSIASYEAMEGPMAVCKGRDAVHKKGEWWYANHEVHSAKSDGPYINGNQFAVNFAIDVTVKETGQRMQMQEVGLYTVQNGKVVEERFLYKMS